MGSILPFDESRRSKLERLARRLAKETLSESQIGALCVFLKHDGPISGVFNERACDSLGRRGLLQQVPSSPSKWVLTDIGEELARILSEDA